MSLVRRIDANHDMTFGRGLQDYATGLEGVVQNVQCRLLVLLGEWFLDISVGVAYQQDIEIKNTSVDYDASLLKQCILDTEDVIELSSFTFTVSGRQAKVQATVVTSYNPTGTVIEVDLTQ